jgi:hypothetical protein
MKLANQEALERARKEPPTEKEMLHMMMKLLMNAAYGAAYQGAWQIE